MRRRSGMLLSIILSAALLVMAGCDITDIGGPTATGTTTATATGTTSPHPTSVAGTGRATAALAHAPVGSSDLIWEPSNQSLRVLLALVSLAPGSKHPAEIRNGTCASGGAVVYALPDLIADDRGAAHVVPTIDQVVGGIPNNKWFLAVHNAPGDDSYARLLIACANIANANTATNKQQVVHVLLTQGQGANQAASGTATFTITNDTLSVKLSVSGLEPRSTHPVVIRFGDCTEQSTGVYRTLPTLTATTAGTVTSTTTLANVSSIPVYGWYVVVHRGTNLDSAIDFDEILCGNVVPA